MRTTNDISSIKQKNENYLRNYPILLKQLKTNIISKFLSDYIDFLQKDNDIYIHKFLLKKKLIDKNVFIKIEERNLSVFELATTTEFELSNKLEISKRKAFFIKIIAQFHFSNLYGNLKVYYAHPKAKYIDSIEQKELKIIFDYFPFAEICNPSKLEPIWNENNCSEDKIMDHCLDLVSQSDIVIFSPFNEEYIGKGVYEEVSLAERLNIPCYIVCDGKLQDYTLGEKNENNWNNFCDYKPISLLKEDMFHTINESEIKLFFERNRKLIENNIINKKKKYIVICNTTSQTEFDIKNLYQTFKDSDIRIIPILGKSWLCKSVHIDDECESNKTYRELENFPFFDILRENITKDNNIGIANAIKESTPEGICPYLLLYEFVKDADIILLNKIFFRSIRLRTKLRKKILFDDPFRFILTFDNTTDLFNDNIEDKCFDGDLEEAKDVLTEEENEKNNTGISILRSLLDLKEGESIEVNYDLTKFLIERYNKRNDNTNILENIFDICKTPFGTWRRRQDEIVQIIDSKSLKNFLNYFFKVFFIGFNKNEG